MFIEIQHCIGGDVELGNPQAALTNATHVAYMQPASSSMHDTILGMSKL